MNWILVFIGGGIGSLCRYGISRLSESMGWRFAISTLVSNVIATLILALVWTWMLKRHADSTLWWSFLAVGICGGFSTFSTFSLETVKLMRDGYVTYSIAIIFFNLLLCLGSIYVISKWMA